MHDTSTSDLLRQELEALTQRSFFHHGVSINNRPIIAWALNDRLEHEQLARQLHSFKQAGYGGVMLEVWRGCPYEVMSDDWLDSVGIILHLAKKEGMEVWIWDDWVFPSGPAGGLVTRDNDEFKSKVIKIAVDLVLEPNESVNFCIPERAIAAAVFPVDKFNNPNGEFRNIAAIPGTDFQYTATTRERLIIVRWQIVSTMQNTPKSQMEHPEIYTSDDPDVFSVDMFNPAATQRFLELVHQRYWDRFPTFFGSTIKGFFFDEPGQPNQFPWYEGLLEQFRARKGYDLLEHLIPMLVEYRMYDVIFDLQSEEVKRVKADYMDVWSSVMAENFYGRIQAWCHAHGVLSTGHQSNDESLKPLLSNTGVFFKNMAYNDLPGTDVVFSQLDPGTFIDFPRLAGSSAAAHGKPGAISESFAVTGHGMDVDAMRYIAEHQIVRGITKFFDMMANYNPERGLYFHPPELSDINLMMRAYGHHLHARVGNLCALMSSGDAPAKVALFVPMENYYRGENAIAAELDYLAQVLTYHQRQFDYLWDADVLNLSIEDGILTTSGGQRYSALLLPPEPRLPDDLQHHLASLSVLSGSLIAWKQLPSGLEDQCLLVNSDLDLLTLIADSDAPFTIENDEAPVSLVRRNLSKERQLVFLLNEACDKQVMHVNVADGWKLFQIDPGDLTVVSVGGPGLCHVNLAPTMSCLLLFDASGRLKFPAAPQIDEENAITPVDWELSLPDKRTLPLKMPLPSWSALGYPEYHGTISYRTTFTWEHQSDQAWLNLGDLRYAATVVLDGETIGDCVWTPRAIQLTGLHKGEHYLEIHVVNTMANLVCGTDDQYNRLQESGAFRGTYFPLYIPRDRQRVISGLFGPVTISPLCASG